MKANGEFHLQRYNAVQPVEINRRIGEVYIASIFKVDRKPA
jgi:hypothetical protein